VGAQPRAGAHAAKMRASCREVVEKDSNLPQRGCWSPAFRRKELSASGRSSVNSRGLKAGLQQRFGSGLNRQSPSCFGLGQRPRCWPLRLERRRGWLPRWLRRRRQRCWCWFGVRLNRRGFRTTLKGTESVRWSFQGTTHNNLRAVTSSDSLDAGRPSTTSTVQFGTA